MTDQRTQKMSTQGNTETDPDDGVSGDEPMTSAQRADLKALTEEAHASFDQTMTRAEASRRMGELQASAGRGTPPAKAPANEPPDESALESLGKAVSAPLLGDDDAAPAAATPGPTTPGPTAPGAPRDTSPGTPPGTPPARPHCR